MISGLPAPETIKDRAEIVNEAMQGKVQANLTISNCPGGTARLIARKISDRFHSKKPQERLKSLN